MTIKIKRDFKQLVKQLIDASRDQKAGLFLAQRISFASQRGNAVSLLETLAVGDDAVQFFDACIMLLFLFIIIII